MNPDVQMGPSVEVSKIIAARPETVFGILSTEAGLSDWMGGSATYVAEAGTDFEIDFPQFQTVIAGSVVEVDAPRRLVLTWGVREGPQAAEIPVGSTKVTIELASHPEGTEVRLFHTGFAGPDIAGQHDGGWRFHLSQLQLKANRESLAGVVPEVVEAWFAAWSETDVERRRALLRDCCDEGVVFADEWADFTGRDRLSVHIGMSQKHMPGVRIVADGEPRVCRSEVLIPWRMEAEDGSLRGRGTNHGLVELDGRFGKVTGFWTPSD